MGYRDLDKAREASRLSQQRRRSRLKQAKICVDCGSSRATNGRITCDSCTKGRRKARQKIRQRWDKENKCLWWGHPLDENGKCQQCLKYSRKSQMDVYYERKKRGLCTECGRKSRPGKICCLRCKRAKTRWAQNTRIRLIESGLCGRCGQRPLSTYAHCHECAEDMKKRLKKSLVSP